jgi:Flp pilus assembly protein TadG
MKLQRTLRRLADTSGANLMEAAIITPLLLILTFGIVDFAGMFYVWAALENGVSVATRFAITGNTMADPSNPSQNLSHEAAIMAAMRNATPTVTINDADFTFSHMSPGGSTWAGGAGGPNDVGKVTVTHVWTPLTPILGPFLTNGKLTVSVDSAMKNESKFQ